MGVQVLGGHPSEGEVELKKKKRCRLPSVPQQLGLIFFRKKVKTKPESASELLPDVPRPELRGCT